MAKTLMKRMLDAGVHFGHRARFWHPKMKPYIYGVRNGIHIINLEKTLPKFIEAINFIGSSIATGKIILFVGTKRTANSIIKEEAIRCGMPYVNHSWLGGMVTNYQTIKKSIKRLKDLEFLADDNFVHFAKKEALGMMQEMKKLERNLGGIKDLDGIPDIMFIIDIGYEKNAVLEARKLNLPIVAVVDTNYSIDGIDYMIPGNDDSIRAIKFYVKEVADAILEAKSTLVDASAKKSIVVKKVTKKIKNNVIETKDENVTAVKDKSIKAQDTT